MVARSKSHLDGPLVAPCRVCPHPLPFPCSLYIFLAPTSHCPHPHSRKCYSDFTPPPPGKPRVRVLGQPVYTGSLTQEYCAQLCHNRGAALAGVENDQCFCGQTVLPPAAPVPAGCTSALRGGGQEKTGGQFQILVYRFTCSGNPVPPPPPPPPPLPPAPANGCAVFNQENCSKLCKHPARHTTGWSPPPALPWPRSPVYAQSIAL